MDVKISDYNKFLNDFEEFGKANKPLIKQSMSNVFSMRLIGNKTHGDLAEVALAQLIDDHMEDYSAKHVGKDLFRAKSAEEDIEVTTPSGALIPISLKAYGIGPLQLSTNKECTMFPMLVDYFNRFSPEGGIVKKPVDVKGILADPIFSDFHRINVFPLIYDEKKMKYNIMVFDARKAYKEATSIQYVKGEGRRKHAVFKFLGQKDDYIFEVRYGDQTANALQRGLWTHTKNASTYFRSLTGWLDYTTNTDLVKLVGKLLIKEQKVHTKILNDLR